MTQQDVFLPVGAQPSLDDLIGQAIAAEDLGYDRAWFSKSWGRDAVTAAETDAFARTARTEDFEEEVRAFGEERTPEFEGY